MMIHHKQAEHVTVGLFKDHEGEPLVTVDGINAGTVDYLEDMISNFRRQQAEYRSASFLMDVPSNPASPTRIIMKAGQVVMVSDDDATIKRPFVVLSGVLHVDELRVPNLSALSAVLGNVPIAEASIGPGR